MILVALYLFHQFFISFAQIFTLLMLLYQRHPFKAYLWQYARCYCTCPVHSVSRHALQPSWLEEKAGGPKSPTPPPPHLSDDRKKSIGSALWI